MTLDSLNKKRFAAELIGVLERYQQTAGLKAEHYEAVITQCSNDHLIIKLQLVNRQDHDVERDRVPPS